MIKEKIEILSKRKQEILDVAKMLFSEKGYASASMRDLAHALKIKPASLYSHYTSKEEMLWEILLRATKDFHEAVIPIAANQEFELTEKLDIMLKAHLKAILRNSNSAVIYFYDWKHLEPVRREKFRVWRKEYEDTFTKLIFSGIEKGVFREVGPSFAMRTLLNGVNWISRWYLPTGRMSMDEIEQNISTLLVKGLVK